MLISYGFIIFHMAVLLVVIIGVPIFAVREYLGSLARKRASEHLRRVTESRWGYYAKWRGNRV